MLLGLVKHPRHQIDVITDGRDKDALRTYANSKNVTLIRAAVAKGMVRVLE